MEKAELQEEETAESELKSGGSQQRQVTASVSLCPTSLAGPKDSGELSSLESRQDLQYQFGLIIQIQHPDLLQSGSLHNQREEIPARNN